MRKFSVILFVLMAAMASAGCDSMGNAKRHRAMEENNKMVFMFQRINKQLVEWTKAKTNEDKAKKVEELLRTIQKEERPKLDKMEVVDELKPVKEEMYRYLSIIEEGYKKILENLKSGKNAEVEKIVRDVNAKLKMTSKNLIHLQEQAAKKLGVKINKKMLTPSSKTDKSVNDKDKKAGNKGSGQPQKPVQETPKQATHPSMK